MMSNKKHILTEKEFAVWCKNMVESFKSYEKNHPNICLLMWGNPSESSRKTVIINMKTMKTSYAKCHPNDEFSRDVGIAIAWARYNSNPIPQVVNCNAVDDFDSVIRGEKIVWFDKPNLRDRKYVCVDLVTDIDKWGRDCAYLLESVDDDKYHISTKTFRDCYIVGDVKQ
jgi:hypothetical protein